ncbi:MFS transporter [Streptomyces sp. NBC_00147]
MSARTPQRRTAAASVVGSILEWYDFFLFGASAAIVFNKVFFPNVSPFAATLASFATFGLGFAVRPIGGLVLAHLGDRIGRRPVLILTVVLMGAGTLAIGFLPTYHQIGIWAPVLLVLCRMMQGFGVGAELGSAYVMSTEAAKAEKRGFYGSLPGAGEFIGVVIASGAVAAVSTLPEDDFLGWGWRIPFLASALVVIIALVIRNAARPSSSRPLATAASARSSPSSPRSRAAPRRSPCSSTPGAPPQSPRTRSRATCRATSPTSSACPPTPRSSASPSPQRSPSSPSRWRVPCPTGSAASR